MTTAQAPIPTLDEWQAACPQLRSAGTASLTGPCPLCGGDDRFHVAEKGGRVIFGCRGCMNGEPDAVRARRFGQILRAVFGDDAATTTPTPTAPSRPATRREQASQQEKADYVAACWQASTAIPRDRDHPGRRWLWHRTGGDGPALWQPDIPVPAPVRFLDDLPAKGYPYGNRPTGPVLIVLLAPSAEWIAAWPAAPLPQALAVHFIDHDGRGIRRLHGTTKVTWGAKAGAFGLIGNPHPETGDTLSVVEGLADGLAVAARQMGSVLVNFARPPSRGPAFDFMAEWAEVHLYSDCDPDGTRDATRARSGLIRAGVDVRATVCDKHKDYAACCEDGEWPLQSLQGRHTDIVDLTEGWAVAGYPLSEAARLASLTLVEPETERTDRPDFHGEDERAGDKPGTAAISTAPQQQGFLMPPSSRPH